MKKEKEHKCWYCMTDAEKNEWLKFEGFSIRYPIEFIAPKAKFYFNGIPLLTQFDADIHLSGCYNPRELIPLGF